jgi:hypothetical protein
MNSTYDYPLGTDYMWFKMILDSFRGQSSKDNTVGYFMHQFSVRNDVFEPTFFFAQSKEHAVSLKKAFEQILSNNNKLPDFSSSIIDQVYKCEFVFGYDPSVKFSLITEDKKPLIELRDFDKIIEALKSLIFKNSNRTLSKRKEESNQISVNSINLKFSSFTYKKINTGLSNLTDLMKSLKRENLISKETNLADFRKVFSGGIVKEKIVWLGSITDLSYFIKQLNYLKYVEPLYQKHWIVVVNCFTKKNQEPFDRFGFNGLKIPAKSKIIDSVLNTLK